MGLLFEKRNSNWENMGGKLFRASIRWVNAD